jgi:hypothetical protein
MFLKWTVSALSFDSLRIADSDLLHGITEKIRPFIQI